MTHAEDIAALEATTPWHEAEFRADLALLSSSVAAAARQFGADARVLARLAARVPRADRDERGATPWTSFRQEVAVARAISSQAAAHEIRTALRLTTVLPHTMHLLETGALTVSRARTFVEELEPYDDELAGQLDADHAERIATLAPWKIKQTVQRAALALDPDVAAARKAAATAKRSVAFTPQPDGQASVFLTGPAVPLTRWYNRLDSQARGLRQAGDPRTLDLLRFDLATSTFPCTVHPPAEPTADSSDDGTASTGGASSTGDCSPGDRSPGDRSAGDSGANTAPAAPAGSDAPAGLRLSGVEAASADCRRGRPVQAMIVVPVETALGLSNEPAWLDGYGWLDAPSSRELLVDAELRRVCAHTGSGQVVDLDDHDRRPPPSPDGVRGALLELIGNPITLTDTAWCTETEHDPSEPLRTLVTLRDRSCDGPTQPATPSGRCQLDHDQPWPTGPTAAWNLTARSTRTHQLKHYGWTPLRTATGTLWTSPAGQLIEIPRAQTPPPGIDTDPTGQPPALPDPGELHHTDRSALRPPTPEDLPPWLPISERPQPTDWTWLGQDDDVPF